MNKTFSFSDVIDEYARVLKKGGYLILSIPKKTCFIYKDCKKITDNLVEITNDPFNLRNGETMAIFDSEKEIASLFSKHFENFTFGSIHDNCFGFDYHWHLIICQKK